MVSSLIRSLHEPDELRKEWIRLVGLCARLTGDIDAAEDLAQETLLEAWRSGHRLRDEARQVQWLSGIAHNVCRRWMRARALAGASPCLRIEERVVDTADTEIEVERAELVDVLDRAMARLDAGARLALIYRYVDDLSHREIAERLGVGETAVRARLYRARHALREILEGPLSPEAAALGLLPPPTEWQDTRIWCPVCGQRRLACRREPETGRVSFKCPDCSGRDDYITDVRAPESLHLTSPKAVLSRHLRVANTFHTLVASPEPRCIRCGRATRVHVRVAQNTGRSHYATHAVHVHCDGCGHTQEAAIEGLVLGLPPIQRFWRRHPKMRARPARPTAFQGRPALAVVFESWDHTQAEVVLAADTCAVLHLRVPGA